MPEPPSHAELVALLRGRDLLPAARRLLAGRPRTVTYARVDEDEAEAEPGAMTLPYGAGIDPAQVAAALIEIARAEPAGVTAICPVPADGDADRPGSWGVEDLGVVLASRACLPQVAWVRPDWRRLGPSACQVALAFGANDWTLPAGDPSDPEHLAAAVGWRALAR